MYRNLGFMCFTLLDPAVVQKSRMLMQLHFLKDSWQNITVTEQLKALLPFQNFPQDSSEEESYNIKAAEIRPHLMNAGLQNLVLSFTIKILFSDTCACNRHVLWGFRRKGETVVWRGNKVRTNSTAVKIDCGVI